MQTSTAPRMYAKSPESDLSTSRQTLRAGHTLKSASGTAGALAPSCGVPFSTLP